MKSLLAEKTIIPNFSALDNIYISSAGWVAASLGFVKASGSLLRRRKKICSVRQNRRWKSIGRSLC